ncbi:MAG TPA: ABC transporter ATP-binding protein [Myxococcota bacterium]|nr:ABC transporter ATP-binding protein [Myxococcota bacterium]
MVKRCLRLLRPLRGHLVLLCAGFAGLTLLLVPPSLLFLDLIWTRALQGEPLPALQAALLRLDPAAAVAVDALGPEVRRAVARRTIAGGLAVVTVAAPLFLGLWYYQVWILQRLNQLLRVELLERFQSLSLRYHSEARVGDAIYRLTQDSAMVTSLVEVVLLTPAYTFGGYLLALALVTAIDPRLALLLLAAWLPTLATGAFFSAPLRHGFRAARAANAALTARIQEGVAGIRTLKAYGAEDREQAVFEAASRGAFAAAFDARARYALFAVLVFTGVSVVLAAAAAWGALATAREAEVFAVRLLATTGVSAWSLGLFQWFRDRFGDGTNQLRRLFRTWGRAQDVVIGLERVFEILDLEPEVQDAADAVALPAVRRGLRFREVGFQYREDRPALVSVDLVVPVGEMTAVVGSTGAGKSTLLALALRLFDPDLGAVEVDGVDLRRVRVADLRERVAIALQENLLFGTTIRENIRYAVPEAGDEAVRAAARVAGADEFIEKLPLGYDTPLGERGAKLSTGQRQRLSLARAVLKDAPVLLLDEPTASLDAETEARVLRNLAAWGRGRAILVVTHRLSTVRHAQRIAVLDHGHLVEQGSHDELLARPGGAYRRLVEAERSGAERAAS